MCLYRVDIGKGPARLQSFIQNDIPHCIAMEQEQQNSAEARNRPMYADIGDFIDGVLKDAKFLFPNITKNKEVLGHVMRTFCKSEA